MKKSEVYEKAMAAVIRDGSIGMAETLSMLSVLMKDKELADWHEQREEAEQSEAV